MNLNYTKILKMRGEKSQPDWKEFKEVILRQKEPSRVPLFELHIDKEVVRYFVENLLVREWVEPTLAKERRDQEAVLQNNILVWHQLGYDYLRLTADFRFSASLSFASRSRAAQDTANLSRGTRKWAEEGKGAITTREDFEKFPWPSLEEVDPWPFEFLSKNLPSGMGFFATFSQGIFEILTNELLGLESLGYLIYDNLELVEAVTDKVGELIYGCYRKVLGLDNLLGFVQGDDMGFKTATLVSPQFLRNYVLPWHKKLAHLAHSHNLLYILHSCGNLGPIMEDLISEVKIDAKHSFEDAIMPVAEFKKKYGERIGVLGGVDVNELCRLKEEPLRQYVRKILDECMPGGGYALGTGNSVANYIPIENYLTMLDEGRRWKR